MSETLQTTKRKKREVDVRDEMDEQIVYTVQDPVAEIYNYTDHNLQPYTKYFYRIMTTTGAG